MKMEEVMNLLDKLEKCNFTKFEMKDEGFELKVNREQKIVTASAPQTPAVVTTAQPEVVAPVEMAEEALTGDVVKAPIVGVFYSAPSPDAQPFVKVGQQVKKGDVLFIVEAMKLFNEVTSEFDGVVKTILPKDGDMVQYGEPVMVIE
ncbi:MAG: acetyl-CoA carboxylase biotin carboxyl carrier protein [Eubacteriales bacterium]|jgi:acetyl-CoA carboxylase biotin carboxyl carrier protein